jgi:hypothetical protein
MDPKIRLPTFQMHAGGVVIIDRMSICALHTHVEDIISSFDELPWSHPGLQNPMASRRSLLAPRVGRTACLADLQYVLSTRLLGNKAVRPHFLWWVSELH